MRWKARWAWAGIAIAAALAWSGSPLDAQWVDRGGEAGIIVYGPDGRVYRAEVGWTPGHDRGRRGGHRRDGEWRRDRDRDRDDDDWDDDDWDDDWDDDDGYRRRRGPYRGHDYRAYQRYERDMARAAERYHRDVERAERRFLRDRWRKPYRARERFDRDLYQAEQRYRREALKAARRYERDRYRGR